MKPSNFPYSQLSFPLVGNQKAVKPVRFRTSRNDWLTFLITLLLLQGCFLTEDTEVAGSGNSTGNVGGRIEDTSDEDVGITVSLYPVDHSPLDGDISLLKTQVSNGSFFFKNVPPGTYNAVAWNFGKLKKGITRGIDVSEEDAQSTDTLKVPDISLKKTSRITVQYTDFTGVDFGMVYIPGTGVFAAWNETSAPARITLDGVIPETYSEILLVERLEGDGYNILPAELEVGEDTSFTVPEPRWENVQKVSISSPGITSGEVVENFPVLIRISGNNPVFDVSDDGSLIRFAKSDSTLLPHTVEWWDPVAKTAHIWVLMDTVLLNDVSPDVFMYIPREPRAADNRVFKNTHGYTGVWDMTPGTTSTEVKDVTESANHGTLQGEAGTASATPFGRAIPFNGTDNWVSNPQFQPGPLEFTISLWVKTLSTDGGRLITFSDSQFVNAFDVDRTLWLDSSGAAHFGMFTFFIAPNHNTISHPQALNDNEWHHLTGTVSPTSQAFYVDGIKVAEDTGVTSDSLGKTYDGYWTMGKEVKPSSAWNPDPLSDYFEGTLEDVRILDHAVSEEWVKLNWELHRPGSNLIGVTE